MAPVTVLDGKIRLDEEDGIIRANVAQDDKVTSLKYNNTEFWLKSCGITLENIGVPGKILEVKRDGLPSVLKAKEK